MCEMGRIASYLRVNFFREVAVNVAVVVIAGVCCFEGDVDVVRPAKVRLLLVSNFSVAADPSMSVMGPSIAKLC